MPTIYGLASVRAPDESRGRLYATAATLGVVDVETSPIRSGFRPRTRLWGLALEGLGYEQFKTTREMLLRVREVADAGPLRLYNHHDFDICQTITDGHVPDSMVMRGSRIIRAKMAGADWVNSFAVFPDALAKILKACGYEKKPLGCVTHEPYHKKFGYEIDFYDRCAACRVAVSERNESDTVEALASFIELGQQYKVECGIDPIREGYVTAASTAFAAAELMAGKLPQRLDRREAYRGGRTEAYRIGRCGVADSWDINSSYPFAFIDLPERDWLYRVRVNVESAPEPTPFFAHGDRSEGLVFPCGTFETWIFGNSYERYIRPHGGIRSLKILEKVGVDLSWVKRVAPMMETVFHKRVTGSDSLKYVLKTFMNACYGRLGMRPRKMVCSHSSTRPKGVVNSYKLPSGDYLSFREIYSAPRANYPMAAAITDNARARLYDAMRRAPGVLYCDTDSVYLPQGTGFPFEETAALGGWKKEHTGPLDVKTVKDYSHAGHKDPKNDIKRKGGAASKLWTPRRALAKLPVLRVDKRRMTDYTKRRVLRGGATMPHRY